jgi:hypothetical protein
MIYKGMLMVSAWLEALQRHGASRDRGGSVVEWVVLAAIVFLLAIAVGAKLTSVVDEQLAKIK